MLPQSLTGFDAIRLLLMVGFHVEHTDGSEASLGRGGRVVHVPRDGGLSASRVAALLDAASIAPAELELLLERLRSRDTMPDLGA